MPESPKIVKIDLKQQKTKRQSSKQPKAILKSYSFGQQDYDISPVPLQPPKKYRQTNYRDQNIKNIYQRFQNQKNRQSSPNKNFKQFSGSKQKKQFRKHSKIESPRKQQMNNTSKTTKMYSPNKTNQYQKKLQKYSSGNSYVKISENKISPQGRKQDIFRKSLQKVQKALFNSNKNSIQMRVKTLKEVGKAAKKRAQLDLLRKNNMDTQQQILPPKYDFPITLYGFNTQSERKQQKQQKFSLTNIQTPKNINYSSQGYPFKLANSTAKPTNYENFQQNYQKALFKNLTKQKGNQKKVTKQLILIDEQEQLEIKQSLIDTICEIFELCDKYNQIDKITAIDYYGLMQQLQRQFVIQSIQKQAKSSHKQCQQQEIRFASLLSEFDESFKVIFYKRQANNIYDALYYLKTTSNLETACRLFKQIKRQIEL